jgi:D-glycero-alpha-D-manno-heptose 1-phosphate guanylyltransferase
LRECIILAGGLGTRLHHLITGLPKCLAPVGDQPFLKYLLDYLIAQKTDHFVFSLGYRAEQVVDYVRDHFPGIKTTFVLEENPLGTGGAIKKSLDSCHSECVFVVNADTFFPISLDRLEGFQKNRKAKISLGLKPMLNPDRYGTVITDADSRIKAFREKEKKEYGLINGGIYCIERKWMQDQPLPEVFSFEKDLMEIQTSKAEIFGMVSDVPFIDIGVPEDYDRAEHFLIQSLQKDRKIKNLFLDRDGVINELIPGDYVKRLDEFRFRSESLEELHRIAPFFENIFVVTNQAGIGKGLMTEADLEEIHEHMSLTLDFLGVGFRKIYHCPHRKEEGCGCRKPEAGMLDRARTEFPEISFDESVIIGDSITDIQMGRSRGLLTVALGSDFRDENDTPVQDISVMSLKEFREKHLQFWKK